MSQRTLLITDFFSSTRSTSVSNASLFDKSTKTLAQVEFDQRTPSPPPSVASEDEIPDVISKPSIPSRITFVRHHSAPLHHRSPIKMRERPMEQQDLEDIRARIRAYRTDLYKYKSSYSRSPIKRFHSTGGEAPPSPFKMPTPQTPVKSHPSLPAFERFSPLAASIELPLPDKYQILFEQYKHLDFLVCHTHNNGGISTFEKVQPVIQQKTRRNFTLQTLGQIKTVHPTMYGFQQEKIQLPTLSPVKLNYELTISPTDFSIQSNMQITPSIIVERIDCFRRALFHIVKTHHRNFLSEKLQLKLDELPCDENLVRWHPDFDLSSVPDIDISPLPISPDQNYKQLLASPIEIRQYAERTQSQRVKRALFSTFSSDDVSSTIVLPSPTKQTLSIEGISSSLIDKIRSKETNKLFNTTTDEKQMLVRLEQTIEIVQQFFIAERATSLDFDVVAKQIRDCHSGPLSFNQSTETLRFLHTYPANDGWLTIITIRGKDFIKINQQKSIKTIIEIIQKNLRN